ncbi:general amidase [Amylostereum chailletii]|nr:general amidase [Amylostereum chailletii]
MPPTWQELVVDKRTRQTASIPHDWLISAPAEDVLDVTRLPAECGVLSPQELAITETDDVEVLLGRLASGELSSVQVTTAFYKRAIVAHQAVNCLTEIFVDRALERAAWLDEQLKITGKVVGPLHGLPVSLKDQINLKGLETCMGYVGWLGKYSEKDAVIAEVLCSAGAVPFVRTNVPQTLMWPETFNLVFGRTVNPFNRALTSGGSSGGEGALLGMKGSPLGVGSDLGGCASFHLVLNGTKSDRNPTDRSIRIPAGFNGLYGLRPSCNRVPYTGASNSLEGQDSLPSVLGPLSRSLSGVKAFMKAVADAKPWRRDPLAIRKPWDEDAYGLVHHGGGTKLVFGFIWSEGVTTPQPPVLRALEMTKKALLDAGHEVVDWEPYKHAELFQVTRGIFSAVGDEDYQVVVQASGEPLLRSMAQGDPDESPHATGLARSSAYEFWQHNKRRLRLRKEYLDRWEATAATTSTGRPVDALVSPVAPWAAPPHGKNTYAAYTRVFNALDYAACTFPVTRVDPALDGKKPPHEFISEWDETVYNLYDPEVFKNAPVALQLVGRTLEEEAVIAMTEVVDAALKSAA